MSPEPSRNTAERYPDDPSEHAEQPLLEEENGALTRAVCRQSTAGHFPARMEGKRLRAFRAHFLFTTSGQDP